MTHAEQPAPVTYDSVSMLFKGSHDATERYGQLDLRHHMSRAHSALEARGEFDPVKHGDPEKYPPLTGPEYLELLAVSEYLSRYYRAGYFIIDAALDEGATWAQVADALGQDETNVRAEYRRVVDGQHRLWRDTGRFGLPDAEHAAAVRRATEAPGSEAGE